MHRNARMALAPIPLRHPPRRCADSSSWSRRSDAKDRCKTLPPRLAGFVSLVGILACGAGPGVQANTARSNSKHYDDSTMCQERTMKNEQNDAVEQVIRAFDA